MTKKELEQMVAEGTIKIVEGNIVLEEGEQNGEETLTQGNGEESSNEEQPEHEADSTGNDMTNQAEEPKNDEPKATSNAKPKVVVHRTSPVSPASQTDPRTQGKPVGKTWAQAFRHK